MIPEKFHELTTEQLPSDCYVYKHSTQCGLCTMAAEVIAVFPFTLPVYWLNLLENRSVSNWVESNYGTQHESPQLLKIVGDKVVNVWNHRKIKAENIS
jgi:bacillithiol system protein YtxJ